MLSEILRDLVKSERSISYVSKETGIPQATLQEFVSGRSDGTYADVRLSTADILLERYALDSVLSGATRPIANGVKRMKLSAELEACGVEDSPEKFKERLVDTLQSEFPATTIDELVCQPELSRRYCTTIKAQYGAEWLHNAVILRALMNLRKAKGCPKDLKPTRNPVYLSRALKEAGCELNVDEFRELLIDLLPAMYRELTIDALLCHPAEARNYCVVVRGKAKCGKITDHLILRTLVNYRKSGGTKS